jgi:hypothetical protein
MTDFEEAKISNMQFGGVAYTPVGTYYAALFLTTPFDDGTGGVEVSGGGYARVAIANNLINFPLIAPGGVKSNALPISFGPASSNWGVVTGGGLYDAPTGGNLRWRGDANDVREVLSGGSLTIAAGAWIITHN